MLFLRPQNRFRELDGVYLVGGGTHPGSGLPVIYESAQITSRLVVEDLGIRPAWNGAEVHTGSVLRGPSRRAPEAEPTVRGA